MMQLMFRRFLQIEKINQARGDKAVMDVLGNDWGRQKAADIFGGICLIIQAQVDWQQLVQVWVWAWQPEVCLTVWLRKCLHL